MGDSYRNDSRSQVEIQHFEIPEGYNEFILFNLSLEYSQGSIQKALFKERRLYLSPNEEGIPRRPLESLTEEDQAFIQQLSHQSLFEEELSWDNEVFPNYENPKPEELQVFHRIAVREKTNMKTPKGEVVPIFIAERKKD